MRNLLTGGRKVLLLIPIILILYGENKDNIKETIKPQYSIPITNKIIEEKEKNINNLALSSSEENKQKWEVKTSSIEKKRLTVK